MHRLASLTIAMVLGMMLAWLGMSAAALAQASNTARTKHVEVRLIPETRSVPAEGGKITVALVQKIIPGWHTYWQNAGDSGEPTEISWKLPPGYNAGPIQWPYPRRIPIGPLANFGYEDEVWLLTDVTVPAGQRPGTMATIEASVTWLVCKDTCIPQEAELRLELDVDDQPQYDDNWLNGFANARSKLPETPALPGRFQLSAEQLSLAIALPAPLRGSPVQFFPDAQGLIRNAAEQERHVIDNDIVLKVPGGSKLRSAEERPAIAGISGVLVFEDVGGSVRAIRVEAAKGEVPALSAPDSATAPIMGVDQVPEDPPIPSRSKAAGSAETPSEAKDAPAPLKTTEAQAKPKASVPGTEPEAMTVWGAFGFALLGGLILNLMPCVFPILSMKALALVRNGQMSRDHAFQDAMAYLTGVLVTFCALAAAVIVLRNAGEAVGWGFQLQSPFVVALLAYVLFAVGLNLSGVFQMGASLMSFGGATTGREDTIGNSFLTGILAVVVAAPCTVPFMGAAVGYALTQSNILTFLIFIALGLGLALPWLAITLIPGVTRLIPRPGPWMEWFKEALAFPMYASAAWLLWVVSQQTDSNGLFRILMGFVAIAFAAWIFGRNQAPGGRQALAALVASLALGVSLAMISTPVLPPRATASSALAAVPGSPPHEPYTPERLKALLAEGKPVFVNLTAAWCITCLFNEEVAIATPNTRAAFGETKTVYLKGDWTNRDPAITTLLRSHNRDGVPLYLYYAAGQTTPAVLPQILTEALVVETLKTGK